MQVPQEIRINKTHDTLTLVYSNHEHALPAECPRKLFDGGGLHLLITPQCGKYWCYCYRFAGKNCTLDLGRLQQNQRLRHPDGAGNA